MPRKPIQFEDWPASLEVDFGPYRAVVAHVTDGDTLDVLCDVGFQDYRYLTIRVYNLDAPELFTSDPVEREKGRAARSYLEKIAPPGTRCVIRTDKDHTTFGRYVASVLLEGGRDVASEMVASGYGRWGSG